MPLNGNLNNYGLSPVESTQYGSVTIDSAGKIGKCYSFGTGSSYLTIPNTAMTGFTDECSVAFWLNIISWNTAWSTFFQAGRGGTPWNNYIFGFLRDNTESRCVFAITNASNTTSSNSYPTSSLDINTWYHIALTYKTGKVSIYINGILDHEYSTSIVPDFSHITNISVAKCNNASSYQSNCKINDLRIYDNCLSAKEVKDLSLGLIVHYKLDSMQDGLLPNGIELYDTLQADGNSWINTLIPYDSTKTSYTIKCKFSQPANVGSYDAVFGAYTGENYKTLRIIRGNSNSLIWGYYNRQAGGGSRAALSGTNSETKEVVMTNSSLVCTVGGTSTTYTYGSVTGTNTTSVFYLFAQGTSSGAISCLSKTILHYWTIWDGNKIIGNFLPATMYGVPGMYDTVTGKFFKNSGTGNFTLGNKRRITPREYLQCDTASYIKSGVFPTTSTNFEMKYAVNSLSAETVYFGCSTASYYTGGNNYSLDILTSGSILYTFKNQGYDTSPYTTTANTPFIVKLQGNTFSVNGNPMPANRHTSHPNLEIYLFARNVNGTNNAIKAGKIYYCKFWEGEDLIRDFIPVSYDGVFGLLDKVEMRFYSNAGSGTFAVGDEILGDVPDLSGNGHDAEHLVNKTILEASPRYERCMEFPYNGYVQCTSPTTAARTAAFWLNMGGIPNASTNYQLAFVDYKSKLAFGIDKNSSQGALGVLTSCSSLSTTRKTLANLTAGEWHHIAVVNPGASETATDRILYIDGVQQADASGSSYWTHNVDKLQVGRRSYAANAFSNKISDFRLYATALSETDVNMLYKRSASIDNNAGIQTFMINENKDSVSITKTGLIYSPEFTEFSDRMRTESDGSLWIQVLHHENPAQQIFSAANCWNYDNGGSLYSALWLLKNDIWKQNGKYELLAIEKLQSNSVASTYRWTQTSNPATSSSITGFTIVSGSGAQFTGLLTNGSYGAMHNGATWYSCFGAYNRWNNGIPGFTNTAITSGMLELYIRIPEITVKSIAKNRAAIYAKDVNSSSFTEV